MKEISSRRVLTKMGEFRHFFSLIFIKKSNSNTSGVKKSRKPMLARFDKKWRVLTKIFLLIFLKKTYSKTPLYSNSTNEVIFDHFVSSSRGAPTLEARVSSVAYPYIGFLWNRPNQFHARTWIRK